MVALRAVYLAHRLDQCDERAAGLVANQLHGCNCFVAETDNTSATAGDNYSDQRFVTHFDYRKNKKTKERKSRVCHIPFLNLSALA
jgi:hypothetical protein